MGINVYLLQFHLQLFGFNWELLLNTCYTLCQLWFSENLYSWLDSQFSHTVKALRVQMGIRVDLLQFHLELFKIT